MATIELRNFRSGYYEKVGCRSVAEKDSIEMLLKEKPISKIKMKRFMVCFVTPATYRNLVWMILLDILPIHCNSHDFVLAQRDELYHDLHRVGSVMRLITDKTNVPKKFVKLYLFETNQLRSGATQLPQSVAFFKICDVINKVFKADESYKYWIAKNFYDTVVKDISADVEKLKEHTWILLKQNHNDIYVRYKVHEHMILPDEWFVSCCAGVIADEALIRVWDKMCGGAKKSIVYLCVSLIALVAKQIYEDIEPKKLSFHLKEFYTNHELAEQVINAAFELQSTVEYEFGGAR